MTGSHKADRNGRITRAGHMKLVDSFLSRDPSVDDGVIMPALFYRMLDSLDPIDPPAPESKPSSEPFPNTPPTAV